MTSQISTTWTSCELPVAGAQEQLRPVDCRQQSVPSQIVKRSRAVGWPGKAPMPRSVLLTLRKLADSLDALTQRNTSDSASTHEKVEHRR